MTRREATRQDPLTPEQRQHNMSRIRSRDTRPEMLIRRGLHALGLRYRLHVRRLPGTPDLVFPRARAVIFVHGCFWHGHDCALGIKPKTNTEFWSAKITRNQTRDRLAIKELEGKGWRIAVVWECALKGRNRRPIECVLGELSAFVRTGTRVAWLDIAARSHNA